MTTLKIRVRVRVRVSIFKLFQHYKLNTFIETEDDVVHRNLFQLEECFLCPINELHAEVKENFSYLNIITIVNYLLLGLGLG